VLAPTCKDSSRADRDLTLILFAFAWNSTSIQSATTHTIPAPKLQKIGLIVLLSIVNGYAHAYRIA
jgi:hypothetical protein